MSQTHNTRWVETMIAARLGVSGRNLRYVLAFGTLAAIGLYGIVALYLAYQAP